MASFNEEETLQAAKGEAPIRRLGRDSRVTIIKVKDFCEFFFRLTPGYMGLELFRM